MYRNFVFSIHAIEHVSISIFPLLVLCDRNDVEITKDIFLFGFRNQYLLFKNKAGKKVRCPVRFNVFLGEP